MTTTRTIAEIKAEMDAITAAGRRVNNLQNEGGEGYDHSNQARIDELTDELIAAKRAEWTPEVTAARKAEWNAACLRIGTKPSDIPRVEREVGFKRSDLAEAIRRNG